MNGITISFSLIIAIICAYIGYRIASSKGRSTVLWPILCFFFPLLGLIVLLILPDKNATTRAY